MAKKTIKATVENYTIAMAPRASSVQLVAKDKDDKPTDRIVISSTDEKFITTLKDQKIVTINIE